LRQVAWRGLMKLSVVAFLSTGRCKGLGFEAESFERIFKETSQMGYDGVELFVDDIDRFDARKVGEIADSKGMSVSSIDTSAVFLKRGLSFTDADHGKREKAVENVIQYIQGASVLNSYVTLSLVRGSTGSGNRKAVGRALQCIKRCCQTAKNLGVVLLLEPLNRYEIDFINTLEEARSVVEEIGPESLGLLADTFHMNIEEQSIEDSLLSVRDILKHVHVADSNRLAPGMGHLNFERLVNVLKSIGYDRYLTVEIIPKPSMNIAFEKAAESLRPLISQIA